MDIAKYCFYKLNGYTYHNNSLYYIISSSSPVHKHKAISGFGFRPSGDEDIL